MCAQECAGVGTFSLHLSHSSTENCVLFAALFQASILTLYINSSSLPPRSPEGRMNKCWPFSAITVFDGWVVLESKP